MYKTVRRLRRFLRKKSQKRTTAASCPTPQVYNSSNMRVLTTAWFLLLCEPSRPHDWWASRCSARSKTINASLVHSARHLSTKHYELLLLMDQPARKTNPFETKKNGSIAWLCFFCAQSRNCATSCALMHIHNRKAKRPSIRPKQHRDVNREGDVL